MIAKVVKEAQKISTFVDSLGVETKGIHRYLPSERETNARSAFLSTTGLWISGCCGLTEMSSFFLGPLLFSLGYKDTLIVGTLGVLTGSLVPAYSSTMGPRSGLRQTCSARYLFGPWMVKIVSAITIIGLLGWSVTNCVLGGEILRWLSGGNLSLSVGIVIVSVVTLVVAVSGIKLLLKFESFVGCCISVVIFLMYIIAGNEYTKYERLQTIAPNNLTKIGNRLSFFTLAYSTTSSWGGNAADYYVVFPEHVPQKLIFIFTFFAIAIPSVFSATLGMLIGNAAVGNKSWNEVYANGSLGGLLDLVFDRWGNFGKFLLVILWLSLISNNIMNFYSSAFSVQMFDDLIFKYFSRWFIVIVIFTITLICSLVGKNHFSEILSNFLPMIGYWASIYITLLLEENIIFRSTKLVKLYEKELYEEGSWSSNFNPQIEKEATTNETLIKEDGTQIYYQSNEKLAETNQNASFSLPTLQRSEDVPPGSTVNSVPYYNFDAWNDKYVLTNGIAATVSFFCGVAGAVVGMNQVYYIGPIAKRVGDYGADLGVFLCMAFTLVSYPILRWLELKRFKK